MRLQTTAALYFILVLLPVGDCFFFEKLIELAMGGLASLGLLQLLAFNSVAFSGAGLSSLGGLFLGRRDTMDVVTALSMAGEIPTFSDIMRHDQNQCALKLVCELEVKPKTKLLKDELAIVKLFRNPLKLKKEKMSQYGGKYSNSVYENAAYLGIKNKRKSICKTVYRKCPYNAEQMMKILRETS